MTGSMLDTDILSEFLRGNKKVAERVDADLKKDATLNISIISYYEILNGLLYKDAKLQLQRFVVFAKLCTIIPLTVSCADAAAEIQANLRKNGKEIGHTDTLIAGTAISHDLQLVTNNTKHFKRIVGLELANWTK